jgi:halimadienyl-diphosphate synthase
MTNTSDQANDPGFADDAVLGPAAANLLQESLTDPWGLMSASIYDTARVALLPAHLQPAGSIPYLLRMQHEDGSWSGPTPNYRFISTLSATNSLLQHAALCLDGPPALADMNQLTWTVERGLRYLQQIMPEVRLPDMVAVEYTVPALYVEFLATQQRITTHGIAGAGTETTALERLQAVAEQRLPVVDVTILERLRGAVRVHPEVVPTHLVHSLEVLGENVPYFGPVKDHLGIYGCSPSATAALLLHGDLTAEQQQHAAQALSALASGLDGAQPNVAPMQVFDQAWSLYNILQAGMPLPQRLAHHAILALRSYLTPHTGFGSGSPIDSDDTSMVLITLALLGAPQDPKALLHFEDESHFRCFMFEQNPSLSANAHVLEALTLYGEQRPWAAQEYQPSCKKIISYLLSVQHEEGSWRDKWHASPFYATSCCVIALAPYRDNPRVAQAINRAHVWLEATQRDEGAWGLWQGTLEETAHALRTFLLVPPARHAGTPSRTSGQGRPNLQKGIEFLNGSFNARANDPVRMPLWHGKELYEPTRVVRATVLSALALAASALAMSRQKERGAA